MRVTVWVINLMAAGALVASLIKDRRKTLSALKKAVLSFVRLMPVILFIVYASMWEYMLELIQVFPAIAVLMGLFAVWVTNEQVKSNSARHPGCVEPQLPLPWVHRRLESIRRTQVSDKMQDRKI